MRRLIAALLLGSVSAAGVFAQEFRAVWKSPEVTRLNFAGKKVAATVITDDHSLQMSGEEALARELTALGVNGTATYRMVPREELKSVDRAKGWFERSGVQGVVVLRPVSREKEVEYSPVIWSSGYYQSFWGYWGYGWSNVYVAPVSVSSRTNIRIVIETLVYDTARDALVWAGTSETRNPDSLQEFVKDLVSETVREMRRMKLVG